MQENNMPILQFYSELMYARLSFMGLPCPNLGTGGYGFHGPFEHISVEGMDTAVSVIKEIVKITAE